MNRKGKKITKNYVQNTIDDWLTLSFLWLTIVRSFQRNFKSLIFMPQTLNQTTWGPRPWNEHHAHKFQLQTLFRSWDIKISIWNISTHWFFLKNFHIDCYLFNWSWSKWGATRITSCDPSRFFAMREKELILLNHSLSTNTPLSATCKR